MAKPMDMTTPDPPTTDHALPPGGATAPTARTAPTAPTEARPVPGAAGRSGAAGPGGNGGPRDPAEMRREIERTRARMSGTLDAIEVRIARERESLERQKDALVDRVTLKGVRRKLEREPWRSMAIAFVAGYVIAAIRD